MNKEQKKEILYYCARIREHSNYLETAITAEGKDYQKEKIQNFAFRIEEILKAEE